jgi:hypothetical protein
LTATVGGTIHPGTKLRLAQFASAFVTRIRRHRPAPVRALRFQLGYQGGNVTTGPGALLVLGHCRTGKTNH